MSTTVTDDRQATQVKMEALAQQAADAFLQAFGSHPGFRLAHAKGIVCLGVFEPSAEARELSKAAHFQGAPIPVLVRFSDNTGFPNIPDGEPSSNPKGFGIRFELPDGRFTDIVANGQEGFPAATPADFVAFLRAAVASPPGSAKPTALDQYLAGHPATAEFLGQPNPTPASFATQPYFGNHAFMFVDGEGRKRAVRYQIVPVAGQQFLEAETAAKQPADFLIDEIKMRICVSPVEFRFLAQIAEEGDPTGDVTRVWPAARRKVELGIIRLRQIDPRSEQTQRELTLDPTHLIEGIELADDPLPAFRAQVYAISFKLRQ